MNIADLQRIKDYCKKATAGPWNVASNPGGPGDQPAFPSVQDSSGQRHGADIVAMPLGNSETVKANAAFIANARSDLPLLLDRVEQLEKENERLRNDFAYTQGEFRKAVAECDGLRSSRMSLTFRVERDDSIPAFGAFLRCECQNEHSPVILMNVQALLAPELEDGDGKLIPQTRDERKRLIITTLMHEFGHALEAHFGLPDVEEAIEKACIDWEAAYGAAKGGGQ